MDCLLCLESNTNTADGIKMNSSTWDELNVQKLIEKHLWPMSSYKIESDWLCVTCWTELSGFHKFYTRIEDVHKNFKCLVNSEPDYFSVPDEKLFEPEIELDLTVVATIKQERDDSDLDTDNNAKNIPAIVHTKECINSDLAKDPLTKTQCNKETKPDRKLRKTTNLVKANTSSAKIEGKKHESDTEDTLHTTNMALCSSDSKSKAGRNPYYQPKTNRHEQKADDFVAKHFKLNCNICKEQFAKFTKLLNHFRNVHNERGYAMCCETKFYHRIRLVEHIKYHLDPESFKCNHCSMTFAQRRSLETHIKIHEEKQFSCNTCGKKFMEKRTLDQHILIHVPQEERKFSCEECGKLYPTKDMLTQHKNAVHLKKYYKLCNICGQSLADTNSFRLHMLKHEGIPPPTYSCDTCGLIVAGKRHLKKHMESQHPEGGKKEHPCHMCSKVSPTLRALKKHILGTHKMGYDHKCNFCEKAFKRPEHLKSHVATHTGEDLYNCPWCPKTFKSNGNMHKHRKSAHPKEWEEDLRKRYSGKLPPSFKRPQPKTPKHNQSIPMDSDYDYS